MAQFLMPSLGADMEAGTLVEWLVRPGDQVKRGDIVAVVETQKGAIEIETFESGIIERLLIDVGATVPVGTPLAMIATGEATKFETRAPGITITAPALPSLARTSAPPAAAPATRSETDRLRASPAARRLARSLGLDLAQIKGTGPQGAIVRGDIEHGPIPAGSSAAPKRTRGFDADAMRAAIAAAMARSKREIPHYYLEHRVEMSAAEETLRRINSSRPPNSRLIAGVLAVKAVALAAVKYPRFNGYFRDGRYQPAAGVHVGIAISLRNGGLAAPAIHDAATLTLDELMDRMRDLVARVRAGRMRSSEISDPTITVSSLGERGVEALYGVIYPPQVAIVGIGKVTLQPWIVDNQVVARPATTITLAADHRVSDGHAGALFLSEIGKLLEKPEAL